MPIARTTGRSSAPRSVNVYSARGGCSEYSRRETMPLVSSTLRRRDSTAGGAPGGGARRRGGGAPGGGAAEILELARAGQQIADDQQRPALAEKLERACHR